jgi:shikimate kinase
MGVGKTTIGKKLARSLGLPFIDTDARISAQHGAVPQIFEEFGESHFRDLETETLRQVLSESAVVATGGGLVLRPDNQEMLTGHTVIYLSTDGRHMANRLIQGKRPLLKNGMSDWRRIYDERKPIYERLATFEIDAGAQSLAQCVQEIRGKLGLND